MMREDIDKIYEANWNTIPVLTDEECEAIEFVYNWHPCNFCMEEIVALYHEWGMCIIYDLLPRAQMAMEHDSDIENAKSAVEVAKRRLDALMKKNIKTKEALETWLQN